MNKPNDLINYDRTYRTMICLNPNHDTFKYITNKVGDIKCSICDALMVVLVRPVIKIELEK
jgi:hypothetical protein